MYKLSCFLLVALCISVAFQSPLREKIAKTYNSQIGVKELTGNNDGREVEAYLKAVNLKKGNSWCAAFIAWCYDQHSIKHPHSGWSPAWFPSVRTIYKNGKSTQEREPARGDVFGIYFNSKRRIAHVGFVDEWNAQKGFAITVEGNTNLEGSREGDGVYRKRRLIRQIYAVSSWL